MQNVQGLMDQKEDVTQIEKYTDEFGKMKNIG